MWLTASGIRSALQASSRFPWMCFRWLLSAGLAFLMAGCASLFASGSPPLYHAIEYPASPLDCPDAWNEGVRVWPFSASAPYDREEMILLDSDHKVRFSSAYRWIAAPGVMVADRLLRDLGRSRLFSQATASVGRIMSTFELSGHIHRFAWEEAGDESRRAVLEVEVILWREEPRRDIVLKKSYHLQSPPSRSGSSTAMAEAMSLLVRDLSDSVQRDLCVTRRGS